ncbi:hypothetical protein CEN44_24830, partial [Fischerella muscicola CCMEE 5323]
CLRDGNRLFGGLDSPLTTNNQLPTTVQTCHGTSVQQPPTNNQLLTTNQQPPTNNQQPTTNK